MKKSKLYKIIKEAVKEQRLAPSQPKSNKRKSFVNATPPKSEFEYPFDVLPFDMSNSGPIGQYFSKTENDLITENSKLLTEQVSAGDGLSNVGLPDTYICTNPTSFPNDGTSGYEVSFFHHSTYLGNVDGGFCGHPENDNGLDYSDVCYPNGTVNTNSDTLFAPLSPPAWNCGTDGPTLDHYLDWVEWCADGFEGGSCDYNPMFAVACANLKTVWESYQLYTAANYDNLVEVEYKCCTAYNSNGTMCYEQGCPDDGQMEWTGTQNYINELDNGWAAALNYDLNPNGYPCQNGCDGYTNNYNSFPPDDSQSSLDILCNYPVPGCMDGGQCYPGFETAADCGPVVSILNGTAASNYNSNATYNPGGDFTCIYTGCMDLSPGNNPPLDPATMEPSTDMPALGQGYAATNVLLQATDTTGDLNDCIYNTGCMTPGWGNYDITASIPCDDPDNFPDEFLEDCCGEEEIYGCTDEGAINYNPNATENDGSCGEDAVYGCTNSAADNYNPDANINDGSCIIYGCTDSTMWNYNASATDNDGSCIEYYYGCTTYGMGNYDAAYNAPCSDPETQLNDGVACSPCEDCVYGCMQEGNFNYNPNATCAAACVPIIYGCLDELACNYNAAANTEDTVCNICDYPPEGMACTDACSLGSEIWSGGVYSQCTGYNPAQYPEPNYDCNGDWNGDDVTIAVCMDIDSVAETGIYPWNYGCGFGPNGEAATSADATCYGGVANLLSPEDGIIYSDVSSWCRYAGCRITNPLHPNYGQPQGTYQFWDDNNYVDGIVWGDDGCPPEDTTSFGLKGPNGTLAVGRPLTQGNDTSNAADVAQSISCCNLIVLGCTDSLACNYNPDANQNDGCTYPESTYVDCNGNCLNDSDGDGVCDEEDACIGTMMPCGCNNPYPSGFTSTFQNNPGAPCNCYGATWDNCGSCGGSNACEGCTNEYACNYDMGATLDDGSCQFYDLCNECGGDNTSCEGCMDETACNYDQSAYVPCGLNLDGVDPQNLLPQWEGGNNPYAYDPTAPTGINVGNGISEQNFFLWANNVEDSYIFGSTCCEYADEGYDCEGTPTENPCLNITARQCSPELPEDHPHYEKSWTCTQFYTQNETQPYLTPQVDDYFMTNGWATVPIPDAELNMGPGELPWIWNYSLWTQGNIGPYYGGANMFTLATGTQQTVQSNMGPQMSYTWYSIGDLLDLGVSMPPANDSLYPSYTCTGGGQQEPFALFQPCCPPVCPWNDCAFIPGINQMSFGVDSIEAQEPTPGLQNPNACGYPPGAWLYDGDANENTQNVHQQIVNGNYEVTSFGSWDAASGEKPMGAGPKGKYKTIKVGGATWEVVSVNEGSAAFPETDGVSVNRFPLMKSCIDVWQPYGDILQWVDPHTPYGIFKPRPDSAGMPTGTDSGRLGRKINESQKTKIRKLIKEQLIKIHKKK